MACRGKGFCYKRTSEFPMQAKQGGKSPQWKNVEQRVKKIVAEQSA